jgi:hypothetical protein
MRVTVSERVPAPQPVAVVRVIARWSLMSDYVEFSCGHAETRSASERLALGQQTLCTRHSKWVEAVR